MNSHPWKAGSSKDPRKPCAVCAVYKEFHSTEPPIDLAGRLESQLNSCEEHSMELAAYKAAWEELEYAVPNGCDECGVGLPVLERIAEKYGIQGNGGQ